MTLTLRVLGGVRLETDAGPLQGRAAQRRRLALLAVLAASPSRASRREKLIRILWPGSAEDAARRLLAESLHIFRKELHEDVVLTVGDEVRLNPAVIRCDLADFREAVAVRDWERAAAQYMGPFLDGFDADDVLGFAQWADIERAAIGRDYTRALEALATAAEATGDFAAAAEWWGRLAVHEPYSSRVALHLIQALEQGRERARAVQFGAIFIRRLAEELEIEPDPEIFTALERLRAERPQPNSAVEPRLDSPVREGHTRTSPQVHPGLQQVSPEFEMIRRVGEGSGAVVYLAREPALGRLVAVKVLAGPCTYDPTAQRRFELEARSAARIQHPNVATVFRIGRTPGGVPYLVLPYVSGGSLEERIAAAGPLPVHEVRRYVAQAAAGLAAAHRLGVVHRDVRPANLLYDRDTDRVLLTDFGLAAVLETSHEQAMRLTRPGEVIGNPLYASPEQLLAEPVTERTDIYSLGIVTFELLTGRLPYAAATPVQMVVAHAREEPRRASEFREDVDPELDELILRCLNKRPEHRPFAVDVAEALGWV
jgi:DNA-binding SARP family transcriptional activator